MKTQKTAGAARSSPRLQVGLAHDPVVVRASQQLRHRVFVQEMGARLPTRPGGIEKDRFDAHCHHLVVRDVTSGDVVSSTRILTRELARAAGGFYACAGAPRLRPELPPRPPPPPLWPVRPFCA
jgi:putative hemolysin